MCGHKFSVLLGIYLEFLGHMISFTLLGISDRFPKWLYYYMPTHSVWSSILSMALSTLINMSVYYRLPRECEGYLTVVLIYISIVTNDVKYIFLCLLAICRASLEWYLFTYFAHFYFIYVLKNYLHLVWKTEREQQRPRKRDHSDFPSIWVPNTQLGVPGW